MKQVKTELEAIKTRISYINADSNINMGILEKKFEKKLDELKKDIFKKIDEMPLNSAA